MQRRFRYAVWGIVAILAVLLVTIRLDPGIAQSVSALWGGSSASASSGTDAGSGLGGVAAPNFTLTDQDGHREALSDFHGKVVVLAFIDSRCTDICPLTAQVLRLTQERLGPLSNDVQLLAVNANPNATALTDVRTWTDQHGMDGRWLFLTGPAAQLEPIWADYHVSTTVEPNGTVEHTPAVYVIDSSGRERWLFLTNTDAQGIGDQVKTLTNEVTAAVGD